MNVFDEVMKAKIQLDGVVFPTPLTENRNLSEEFQATFF
jgi:threonine dehydratase